MGLLSTDFYDGWSDWKVELYIALDAFIESPSEETHDLVAKYIKENCRRMYHWVRQDPVIAICNENRKRDALAIQGPTKLYGIVKTWKASKHTPKNMLGCWKERKYSKTLYINESPSFLDTHEIYLLPEEIYESLVKQFKTI